MELESLTAVFETQQNQKGKVDTTLAMQMQLKLGVVLLGGCDEWGDVGV